MVFLANFFMKTPLQGIKMKTLSLFFFLSSFYLWAQPEDKLSYQDFDSYQEIYSFSQLEKKLTFYLKKHSEIENYYHLDKNTFKIYASLTDKKKDVPEYILRLISEPPATKKKTDKKLSELRIALDPGHLGGPLFSRWESRYIDMPAKKGKPSMTFNEGDLALATAFELKILLETQGAKVFLTRNASGQSVYHKSFFLWLEEDFLSAVEKKISLITDPAEKSTVKCWWLTQTPLASIFRSLYNPLDLKARAQKISHFSPDISIMLHYNAGAANDLNGQNQGTEKNFCMAFVPGSFSKGELQNQEARYHFVRLLLTPDIENSIKLSRFVVEEFVEKLQVPPVSESVTSAPYLKNFCLATSAKGVYARNLNLTRLVPGTICFGEPLYQDNYQESRLLSQKDFVIQGVAAPNRVKKVAQAYFQGILRFCER